MLRNAQPDEINYEDLDVKEVIGAGEFTTIHAFLTTFQLQFYFERRFW